MSKKTDFANENPRAREALRLNSEILALAHLQEPRGYLSRDFDLLLQNFGSWSRGDGAPRYRSPWDFSCAPAVMSDAGAQVMESCMRRLRDERPVCFQALKLCYINRFSAPMIAYRLYPPELCRAMRPYLSAMVSKTVEDGKRVLWEVLHELV